MFNFFESFWNAITQALLAAILALFGIGLAGAGCSELVSSHVKMLNVVSAGAVRIMDGMTAEDGANAQYMVSGQADHPGVTVEAGMVYRATAYFDGVSGQFQAGAFGRLGESGQLGETAKKIALSAELNEEQKILLLRDLFSPKPSAAKPDDDQPIGTIQPSPQ